jgi:hypothetical protein
MSGQGFVEKPVLVTSVAAATSVRTTVSPLRFSGMPLIEKFFDVSPAPATNANSRPP